jgi:hypothetical protein
MSSTVSQLLADPSTIRGWTQEELFAVPREEVEAAQLAALKERYEQLPPQIRLVDRPASDIEVDRIGRLEDITPLCQPHTTYKSYSPAHIEGARFERMNRWLSRLTSHDLFGVDCSPRPARPGRCRSSRAAVRKPARTTRLSRCVARCAGSATTIRRRSPARST